MNNDPNKPPSGPPNLNPFLLNWILQYQANQQQNSIMQSLLMNSHNLAVHQMFQLAPTHLFNLHNAVQSQQMVAAMQSGSFFALPPFPPKNEQAAKAPAVNPVNKPVENEQPPIDEQPSTSKSFVQEPEKGLDQETHENAEEPKPTSETESNDSESNLIENPEKRLLTVEVHANQPFKLEKPEEPPAPEVPKKVEELKPKRQRKRKNVVKEESTEEAPKKLRPRLSQDLVKDPVQSIESIISRAKVTAEKTVQDCKRKEALNCVWFEMPPESEYQRFDGEQLKRLKKMAKMRSRRLCTFDENVLFFERHKRIFETLRCQKLVVDIEKEEKRRAGQSDNHAPPISSSSGTPQCESGDSLFSDEVYQAFDMKTHAGLCSMMRESFFNFKTQRAKENKEKRKNLIVWLPKLTQIIKDSQRVFQQKFDVFLENVNWERDQDRQERYAVWNDVLKPPTITDEEKATSGSNEECVKMLKLLHGLSGISFKPMNVEEVVQVRWISVRLKFMRTGKIRRYLKSVMKRIKRKISLPGDYVPQNTYVSTRRLYRIILEDYENERKFGKKKKGSLYEASSSVPPESSVRRISKYEMEVLKITIERIKQMDFEEREALSRRTRESDSELKLLLRLLSEHYSKKYRKRERMSKNAEVLERSRSFPCMKLFEERIKWITEDRLTEILIKVQNTLRSLEAKKASLPNESINVGNLLCAHQIRPEMKLERTVPQRRALRIKMAERDIFRIQQLVYRFKRFVLKLQKSPENERTFIKETVVQRVVTKERCFQFALNLISKLEMDVTLIAPPIKPGTGRPKSLLEKMLTQKSPEMYSGVKMLPLNWNMEDMSQLVESLKSENLGKNVEKTRGMRKRKRLTSQKDSELNGKVEEVATKDEKVPVESPEMSQLRPSDRFFDKVGSRFNQGQDYKKYAITSDEMERRISGFEKLNSSNVSLYLRKAKEKNGGELMREQLRDKGVDTLFNKRQTMRSTNIVALCEFELQDFFKDMESVCFEYPVQEVADELVTSFIDENSANVLTMGSLCDDILKMMYALSSILSSVLPPVNGHLPISSGDKQLNYAMETFSHSTHGFGVQSFRLWVRKSIETFEAMSTHRRLRDADGNRLTAIPLLEEAFEKSKELSSDEIAEIIDEIRPSCAQV